MGPESGPMEQRGPPSSHAVVDLRMEPRRAKSGKEVISMNRSDHLREGLRKMLLGPDQIQIPSLGTVATNLQYILLYVLNLPTTRPFPGSTLHHGGQSFLFFL